MRALIVALALPALAVASVARADDACAPGPGWLALRGNAPRPIAEGMILGEAASQDVVLLGERHESADDHRWELQVLAALHVLQPDMVIGFESFPRRVQPALDRWVAGTLNERQLLEQTDWDKVWSYPARFYLPLFQFARLNRIPMRALNVDHALVESVAEKGWDAVPAAMKEGVSRPEAPAAAYRDMLYKVYLQHPGPRAKTDGDPGPDDPAFLRFVESQTVWDRAMAEAIAQALRPAAPGAEPPLVVGIMGAGHVRGGYGVAHQLRALGVRRIGSLLPVDADTKCDELAAGTADAVFVLPVPAEPSAPPPPRLGVSLAQKADGVTIVSVVPGSLAEASGLRAGDRVLRLAGRPVTQVGEVVAAVHAQPAGTWLPMVLHRAEGDVELLVKFPPIK